MRSWPRARYAALLVPILVAVATLPAPAEERRHEERHEHEGHEGERHHRDFHGRDFRHFDEFEFALWREGRWHHDWYGGRYGWWWEVDGIWYFYPEPVYPYPGYVSPLVEAPPPYPPPPAPVIVQQAPPPPGPAPAQSWYYCDDTRTYYPYVATCASPWRQVPAAPPGGK